MGLTVLLYGCLISFPVPSRSFLRDVPLYYTFHLTQSIKKLPHASNCRRLPLISDSYTLRTISDPIQVSTAVVQLGSIRRLRFLPLAS